MIKYKLKRLKKKFIKSKCDTCDYCKQNNIKITVGAYGGGGGGYDPGNGGNGTTAGISINPADLTRSEIEKIKEEEKDTKELEDIKNKLELTNQKILQVDYIVKDISQNLIVGFAVNIIAIIIFFSILTVFN